MITSLSTLDTLNEIMLLAYNRGWITTFDGNVSYRSAQNDYMVITPTAVRKNKMTREQLIDVPIQSAHMDVADSCAKIMKDFSGQALRPSGELPLHYALQRNISTPQRWVVHVHATHIVAAMMAGIDLQQVARDFGELIYTRVGPNVPVLPAQTNELGLQVAQAMGVHNDGGTDFDIVGIERHGVVAVADDPWTAWSHTERLNHACEVVLLCRNAA